MRGCCMSPDAAASVLGLGYIIGLKYAMIITAGSCLVWFVIVPVVGSLAEAVDSAAMLSLLGVTRADIAALGEGGLCLGCAECHYVS